jgi:hypothetical protein
MKTMLSSARRSRVHLVLILIAALASSAITAGAAAAERAAITISTAKPLGPALGTFSTSGAFSDSGVLVTESRLVSGSGAPFGVVSHLVLRFEGELGTFTIRTQIIETVTDDDTIFLNAGVWAIVDGTGAYATLHGTGDMAGTVDDEANLITRIYTGMVLFQ